MHIHCVVDIYLIACVLGRSQTIQAASRAPDSDNGSDLENEAEHGDSGPLPTPVPSTSGLNLGGSAASVGASRKVPSPLMRSAADYQEQRNGVSPAVSTPTGVVEGGEGRMSHVGLRRR